MRPTNLSSGIFIEKSDPYEAREALGFLEFLDGIFLSPRILSKDIATAMALSRGGGLALPELFARYRSTIESMAATVPTGWGIAQLYFDPSMKQEDIALQADVFVKDIPNVLLGLPITPQGLEAADQLVRKKMNVCMLFCTTQAQAAAVHAATRGARRGQVFLSCSSGALEKEGRDWSSLLENILASYRSSDGHVAVCASGMRTLQEMMRAITLGPEAISAPLELLKEWFEGGMRMPDETFIYDAQGKKPLPYLELDLSKDWREFDLTSESSALEAQNLAQEWKELLGS